MKSQREIFNESEGDAWFRRNEAALTVRDWAKDPVCIKIIELQNSRNNLKILEIGCGDGGRLSYLSKTLGSEVFGIDPSGESVQKAVKNEVFAFKATADNLPFADLTFDVVIFGFCLYLCDDNDLFRIVSEANRVLKSESWLLILDFESRSPVYRPYHHKQGIKSRKMDFKEMFLWHPSYTLASHQKFHHETMQWTDDIDHWISLACLRKTTKA